MTGMLYLPNLPEIALEKVFSYLSYDEVASNRIVCRSFNNICGSVLTKGFLQLERKHAALYKVLKSLLPRRPSERRSHIVVSRYCEILQGVETRLRMLNTTYMRYVDQHLVCFIPGKVLDEISKLLRLVESKFEPPPNNNQLLEELRDLSSMAMEHFDEQILPHIEKQEKGLVYRLLEYASSSKKSTVQVNSDIKEVRRKNRLYRHHIMYLAKKIQRINEKVCRQNYRLKKQDNKIKEQGLKIQVQASKIENHGIVLTDVKKRLEEMQQNYIGIKSELESAVSNTETVQHVSSCKTSTITKSNIKPRCSRILPRNYINLLHSAELRNKLQKVDSALLPTENSKSSSLYKSNIKPRPSKIWPKDHSGLLKQYLNLKNQTRRNNSSSTYPTVMAPWYKYNIFNKIGEKPRAREKLSTTPCTLSQKDDENRIDSGPTFNQFIPNTNIILDTIEKLRLSKTAFKHECDELILNRKRKSEDAEAIPSKIQKSNMDTAEESKQISILKRKSESEDNKKPAERQLEAIKTIYGNIDYDLFKLNKRNRLEK